MFILNILFLEEIENNLCKIQNNGNWPSCGHKMLPKRQSGTPKDSET